MKYIFICFEAIVIAYFAYVSIYTFVFAFASLFYKKRPNFFNAEKKNFAVLIPAYKEDQVIVSVAEKAMNHNYPNDKYEVFVLADSLQTETMDTLKSIIGLNVIELKFEKSTKVRALNKAFEKIGDAHQFDYCIILDADNIMEADFINEMNELHGMGYQAIQGQRAAKNEDNSMAFLDGLSESINNSIYGRGSAVINFSASLKGSGMSFNYHILKNELALMDSIGGFDRELELRLTKQGIIVHYSDTAIVKDEKVAHADVFKNQRKRWISSQYFYLFNYFTEGLVALFKGKLNLFNSIILRNLQLPRLINLGLANIIMIVHLIGWNYIYFNEELSVIWIIIAIILDLGVLLAIPRKYYNKKLLLSIIRLPLIFIQMFLLLFKLKGANKKFIHTPHGNSKS